MIDQCVYVGGDNLDVMRNDLQPLAGNIDLIYLDPPFNSKKDYFCNFPGKEQQYGFDDVWNYLDHKDATDREFAKIENNNDKLAHFLYVVREGSVKDSNHFAYLTFMAARLIEMRKLLKPTGCIYLHVDPSESHYLKIVMDMIFGADNFRNEIIWHYGNLATVNRKAFPKKHDVILAYSKTNNNFVYNEILKPYKDLSMSRYNKTDDDGKIYALIKRRKPDGGVYYGKTYPKEGVPETDVWDIPALSPTSAERLGYPTQKPEALLERIISASCPQGGIVLDPFCGCGTSWSVAAKKNLKYIGIDISTHTEEVINIRVTKSNGTISAPTFMQRASNPESAAHMGEKDKHASETQVVKKLGLAHSGKKGADGGIDGKGVVVLKDGKRIPIIVSVKSGSSTMSQLRDLIGLVTWDRVDRFGIFATRDPATKEMKSKISRMPKIDGVDSVQIITIGDIFNTITPKTIQLPEGAYIERAN